MLAGFDSQFTATASRDFLLSDLEKFLPLLSGLLGDTPVRADLTKLIDGLIYTRVMKPSTPAVTTPPAPAAK